MWGWFGKKTTSEPEVSAGGSVIHRYPNKTWLRGRTDAPDASVADFEGTRRAAYAKLFVETCEIFEETSVRNPRIAVHSYVRRGPGGKDFSTLVTSGMSDLAMKAPARGGVPERVELIFYCSEPRLEYIETMRWLAHFPHDQRTWIGVGHTIPNGSPPAPFWGSSALDTILFLPPIIRGDASLDKELVLDGQPVHFLWVVPLTTPECELKLDKGLDALLNRFEVHQHPLVFDPNRPSYV